MLCWWQKLSNNLSQKVNGSIDSGNFIASVLVLIGTSLKNDFFILTKRTENVKTHKGQISFPGGMKEPIDKSLLHTAIRETYEEIGVLEKDLSLLGVIEPIRTKGALPIVPWVARIQLPYDFKINESEVEKILFLPVDRLIEEGLKKVQVQIDGVTFDSIGIWLEKELIWGATARILERILKSLSCS